MLSPLLAGLRYKNLIPPLLAALAVAGIMAVVWLATI